MSLFLSDLAHLSEQLIREGLTHPGLLTISLIFGSGLLTSLGPCSISLLPITIAYLSGFNPNQNSLIKSLSFCFGIVLSLITLGALSGFLGKIYGQVPLFVPTLVALLAIAMGLNLLGFLPLPLPVGPDPNSWREKVPSQIEPVAAGMAFGLAATPCTTPVLALLLGWIAENGNPAIGILLLAFFGAGQVMPLLIAGTAAGQLPRLLALKPLSKFIPALSGAIFLTTGILTIISRWI